MSKVRLTGATSGYTELAAPAIAGNNTVTLPSGAGSANQLLKNGSTPGALEYSSVTVDSTGGLANVAGINGGPLAGMRNAIINGNFDVWQRGTSFSIGLYGADRWFNSGAGSSCTMSRQAFALGQTDVPGEPTYFCRFAVTSVAGASSQINPQQRVESVRTFAGQTVTISFWAKADASKNIALEFLQNFGTGGSPSSAVTGIGTVKKALTTSWQKVTHTVSIPSISGKTLGSDGNDSLNLIVWLDAGSNFNSRTDTLGQQSGTFDIAQVQVEAGPVATPFERRPVGVELALCQRYYHKGSASLNVYGFTGWEYTRQISLPVSMRIAPTVSQSTSGGVNISSTSINVPDNNSIQIGGLLVGTGNAYYFSSFTASAEL